MALEAGTRLGHYEVVSSLGAGGMGEVYRAKDLELGRGNQLLLEEVDRERLGHFERKVRVLALRQDLVRRLPDIGATVDHAEGSPSGRRPRNLLTIS